MTPEAMIISLKLAYESLAATQPKQQERLRIAYERLFQGCLAAYFNEADIQS